MISSTRGFGGGRYERAMNGVAGKAGHHLYGPDVGSSARLGLRLSAGAFYCFAEPGRTENRQGVPLEGDDYEDLYGAKVGAEIHFYDVITIENATISTVSAQAVSTGGAADDGGDGAADGLGGSANGAAGAGGADGGGGAGGVAGNGGAGGSVTDGDANDTVNAWSLFGGTGSSVSYVDFTGVAPFTANTTPSPLLLAPLVRRAALY